MPRKARTKQTDLAKFFFKQCKKRSFPKPVAEYRFAPPRRWRFDFAFIEEKIAVEVQGGIFIGGRHCQGAALIKEYEKLNSATCLSWKVLLVIPSQVRNGEVFDLINLLRINSLRNQTC